MFWTEGRKGHGHDDSNLKSSNSSSSESRQSEPLATPNDNTKLKQHQQEEVLRDTQDELEKERAKRRELEEKIAQLEKQQKHQQAQKRKSATAQKNAAQKAAAAVSNKRLVALQAEVDGFRQIVDMLTVGRPAIDAAVAANRSSVHRTPSSASPSPTDLSHHFSTSNSILVNPHKPLPLHTVRFLELMPWHQQAMDAAVVTEELYEWQAYSVEKKAWKSELVSFPTFFQALPVVAPGEPPKANASDKKAKGKDAKVGVWTNQTLTLRFDLRNGCILPNRDNDKQGVPTWKWIGGWEVQKSPFMFQKQQDDTTDATTSYFDQDGWTYAKEGGHFLRAEESASASNFLIPPASLSQEALSGKSSLQHDSINSKKKKKDKNTTSSGASPSFVRRRKWSRQRVLVDYPHASETTIHFLKLLAQQEELKVTNALLQNSYKTVQQSMADMEVQCAASEHQWSEERRALEARIESLGKEHKERLESLERTMGPPVEHFACHSPLPKVIFKHIDDNDNDDSDDDTDCSSDDEEEEEEEHAVKSRAGSMLLHPEGETVDRRASGSSSKRSFFGWGSGSNHKEEQHSATASSPTPEAEPCSDDNSISSFDRDAEPSESSTSTDDDASLAIFSASPPPDDRRKSFLHMWFGGKHDEDHHDEQQQQQQRDDDENKQTTTGLGDAQQA